MLVRKIETKNFRSIKNETLSCDRLTAIIGRNGAGKSTFLQAIDKFLDNAASFNEEDFFNRQTDEMIEIRVTFNNLQPIENEEFSPYINDDELIVTKRISFENDRFIQRYFAAKMQFPQFAILRAITGKNERRNKWNELVDSGDMPELKIARNADQIEQMMQEYESTHPDSLEPIEQEVQFFGARNIGGGKLDKFTKYVLVPAVHEVTDETTGKKGAIEQLLEMVVLRRVNSRSDIQTFKTEFETKAKELYCTENLTELQELGEDISSILESFAPGSKLNLVWDEFEPPVLDPPSAIATLIEDEFEGEISHKGHGLQRALILTLLQYLAKTTVEGDIDKHGNKDDQQSVDDGLTLKGPDLILAIEEPELYLHPSRCRYLSNLLYSLCQDEDTVHGVKTQIIYTSHSPYLVDLHRFDQIRVVRKVRIDNNIPETKVTSYSLDSAAAELARICEDSPELYTRLTFKARAMSVMNVIVNEGFFSNSVVVVEGISDVGTLWKMQELLGMKWDEKGIVIVPAGGKNNIDRPVVVFRGLKIPVYFVFDADAHHQGRKAKLNAIARNHRYQRMAGVVPVDFPETQVHDTWAVFNYELERTLMKELNDDVFMRIRDKVATELGYDEPSRVMKNIEGSSRFIEYAYELGNSIPTLEDIIRKITQLSN